MDRSTGVSLWQKQNLKTKGGENLISEKVSLIELTTFRKEKGR